MEIRDWRYGIERSGVPFDVDNGVKKDEEQKKSFFRACFFFSLSLFIVFGIGQYVASYTDTHTRAPVFFSIFFFLSLLQQRQTNKQASKPTA
jgi:hypothetical protein